MKTHTDINECRGTVIRKIRRHLTVAFWILAPMVVTGCQQTTSVSSLIHYLS